MAGGSGPGAERAEQAIVAAEAAAARFDLDGAVADLSFAIRTFTEAGDRRRAAMACVRLGDLLAHAMGNLTAARAWFVRAARLVADEPPCVEQGWVAVAGLGCDVDDPDVLLAAAELALDRARTFGDVNLETKALADAGLAHVQAGRIRQGMALLDEAMALACGPADPGETTAMSVCSFFTACYHAVDFVRAGSWADLLRRQGLIGPERGGPIFLSSHCDSVQATLLVELGQWGEAEAVLLRAKAAFEDAMHAPSVHPDIALAELRLRQGRLAEAEVLLLGKDQSLAALLPAARLHLARGDTDLAEAAARRGLRALREDRLRAIELLTLLVDVELARGDVGGAAAVCAELIERAGSLDVPALQARATAATARVTAATGDPEGAIAMLETTVDRLDPSRLPWLRAILLIDLARLRDRSGDRATATADAEAAAASLASLDVVLAPADADLLARLSTRRPGRPAGGIAELGRDGKWWTVSFGGSEVRLRNTKGLAYLAQLIVRPGIECHALDMVDRVEGLDAAGGVDRRGLGDAGEILDARARTAYRHRIEELRAAADEEIAAGRLEAAIEVQDEIDQLVAQLAQAFGLGGRQRRAGSVAERARLNVTRAVRAAIAQLVEVMPVAGGVLDRRVRTGMYCAYEPVEDGEVGWIVRSGLNDRRRD